MNTPQPSGKSAGQPAAGRPNPFPDFDACRLQPSEFGDNLECLSVWKQRCPYGIPFGPAKFCSNPHRLKILARIEKKP